MEDAVAGLLRDPAPALEPVRLTDALYAPASVELIGTWKERVNDPEPPLAATADDETKEKFRMIEEQLSDEVYEGVYWNQRLYYKLINEGSKESTQTGEFSWECRENDEIVFENRAEALRFKKMFVDAVHGRNTFGNSKWVPSMHEQLKKFFLGDWLQRYNRDTKSYDKVDRQEVFNEEAFKRFLDSTNKMSINQLYRN